ncbi:MAG: DNA polymerase III subunit chi [Rickettsiaceae bacterium]|nr:DNA polymerase III subunit chi [Rickettsiaceae bacterium]MDP4832792.1 DNA polymerase III subunit chi [Rickettsiaceae bacterium]MDP5020910.1 DNA polymerase III subunit chi [Rickettsiaceae bacterium]MDP5082738.1 DNA polymerase III subunit chi [Rickettsiaceae bacterium]
MIKISCYQTTQSQLAKTFCQLTEKCYYSNLKTNVFTENEDYSQNLDRVLWTYSKKHFIPHATSLDPLPEKQPVFITHNLNEYNQAEIIIFVNPSQKTILESFSKNSIIKSKVVQKILFIYDDIQKLHFDAINKLLEKSYINKFAISAFSQANSGAWEKSDPLSNHTN